MTTLKSTLIDTMKAVFQQRGLSEGAATTKANQNLIAATMVYYKANNRSKEMPYLPDPIRVVADWAGDLALE